MAKSPQVSDWKPAPLSSLPKSQIPAEMFKTFKKQLGEINPHLCLIDTALQDFAQAHSQSQDGPSFLRQHSLAHGHRRLVTDKLDVKLALRLAYTAQVALLQSKLEQLCKVIQKHGLINSKLKEKMEGDFLRRTLWLIASSREVENVTSPIENEVAFRFVTPLDLAVLDFYRKVRNLELHAAVESDLTELHSKIDINRCKAELGYSPALQGDVTFRDVLVVSKICQRIAHDICRAVADPDRDIIPALKRRFGSMDADRRRNGARAFMVQSYLLDVAEAEMILYNLAWKA